MNKRRSWRSEVILFVIWGLLTKHRWCRFWFTYYSTFTWIWNHTKRFLSNCSDRSTYIGYHLQFRNNFNNVKNNNKTLLKLPTLNIMTFINRGKTKTRQGYPWAAVLNQGEPRHLFCYMDDAMGYWEVMPTLLQSDRQGIPCIIHYWLEHIPPFCFHWSEKVSVCLCNANHIRAILLIHCHHSGHVYCSICHSIDKPLK